jgi:hypothetical protein
VCLGAYLWTFQHNGVSLSCVFLISPKDSWWSTGSGNADIASGACAHDFLPHRQQQITHQVRVP